MDETTKKPYRRASGNNLVAGCGTIFAIIAMIVGTIVIVGWAIQSVPFIREPLANMVCI